jgi:glucose-1-phosphate thymidylyltransferase
MKAIIPVAGFGTRMRPHTLTHPKVLLPVADKPMIAHIVDKIVEDGIDELIFVVGYLGEKIEEFIRGNYKVKASFVEQKEFLGLGHAIYTASDYLGQEPVFVVLGDTIYDVDLKPTLKSKTSSLGVKTVEDPRPFGIAILDNQGFITKLEEKPENPVSNLTLVGLYFFKNGNVLKKALSELITKNIRTNNEYQLTDAVQLMIDQGEKISTFNVEGWYDCGKPDTLLETTGIILQRDFFNKIYNYKNVIIHPPVYIHESAKLEHSVIGPNVTIAAKAHIANCIISKSIIGPEVKLRYLVITDSIIGNKTSVTGEPKTLNLGDYSKILID